MSDFSQHLLSWYEQHQRRLPWRLTKDPYRIWLSEIILQQTRVVQGIPYYQAFIDKFPTIHDLAACDQVEVLRLWQGLGYYTRARNLYACAKTIVSQLEGKFPNRYEDLLKLPGIGSYTAAAIASIAFKEAVPVVDGNVLRVLSRIFGITTPINTTTGKKLITQLAQSLIDTDQPDKYNQAIMDFGAIQCLPAAPLCNTCIFQKDCFAFKNNQQATLPVKSSTINIKKRYLNYLVIVWDGKVFMNVRPTGGIWTGLYDFYLVEADQPMEYEQLEDALVQLSLKENLPIKKSHAYKHVLTHQILHTSFFIIHATKLFAEAVLSSAQTELTPFGLGAIHALPKPMLVCNFIKDYLDFTTDSTRLCRQ